MAAFFQGLGLGAGLIVAIGAQNAFVLRQGLARGPVITVATVCFACDAVLIAAGAFGLGALIASTPWVLALTAWGGAAFLAVYGALSFRNAFRGQALRGEGGGAVEGGVKAVMLALSFSLLNPHVYLDTVVLLGSVAAQVPAAERQFFALGGMTASFLWFYGLGLGAAWAARWLARPAVWTAIDVGVGLVMWTIAGGLIADQLR